MNPLAKNRSSKLKQFELMTFLLLEYIYIIYILFTVAYSMGREWVVLNG